MNKLKFINLIIGALALLTASNAISQTKFSIKTTPPQEALDYVQLQYVHMPLLSKAWGQYLTSRTGMRLSEYGDVITALYNDLSLSYEAYNTCLRQDTAQSKKTSDIWLKDLQNNVSQADIIQHKEVIKKTLGVLHLISMVRACHEEEKTVIIKESYLTHALAELLKDQLAFIKTQDNATQQKLQEHIKKINKLLQALNHPVVRTTVAANGFNAHRFERSLEACQKQNPTVVDLLRHMPSLQRPFDVFGAIEALDNLCLSTP